MSTTQEIVQSQEVQKNNDTEHNLRQLRKQAEAERNGRLEAERRIADLERQVSSRAPQDDDYSDEPYIDEKRLNKKLSAFEKTMDQKIEERAEQKARSLIDEEKKYSYLKENHDFNASMSPENVQKFAEKFPKLAENILRMPDGFERQKLVYENIKALGIDRPEEKLPSIQEKIDANRRSPFYQPTGNSSAPYSTPGGGGKNYSEQEKKQAYDHMVELKSRLRLG